MQAFTPIALVFSGACSGCGETPYVKLIAHLFGDRQIAANATGCTSIYSGSVPSTPYTTNEKGHGPAWSNSLFEDFCEYGLGMQIAHRKIIERLVRLMTEAQACECCSDELKAMFQEWIANKDNAEVTNRLYEPIVAACEVCRAPHSSELSGDPAGCEKCQEILKYKDHIVKRSQWIIGGDNKVF